MAFAALRRRRGWLTAAGARSKLVSVRGLRGLIAATMLLPTTASSDGTRGLTAVAGLKVGHHTLSERPTGCTVILAEAGATAGVDVRGGAPGTRETDLLDPVNTVQQVHAITLAGGSAFGLDAATGVVRYLEERGIGFDVRVAKVPIVPAAILIDLWVGGKPSVRPTAECGYLAAKAATDGPVAEGNVGAGAGATVGKLAGLERGMKAGIGTASITLPHGLTVAALVAVNAAGDVIDPATGRVVAGVRTPDGKGLADARALLRSGELGRSPLPRSGEHTTIGVVATNAALDKAQATKVAQMAHDGLARAISPVHTPVDGDTIFALATGRRGGEPNVLLIGALAAEVTAEAVVRAARQAEGIPGYPAARDLTAPAR
jgi:L-aminopeptidase/D-esterase-like protein